jgi:light-regulated signal transduction histidine kinase (bacteriophytochrome)
MVVAELVDPNVTIDLYKGLHFPASDIPAQARELYKINKVRLLYDRDQVTSRLVCRTVEDLETPLDMTHAYLRAMSPIHIKYLAHMKVRSSYSVSISAFRVSRLPDMFQEKMFANSSLPGFMGLDFLS